jgi:hypothetical protein
MRTDRYYFIAALPALGELGTALPIGFAQLMEHVGELSRWGKLVGTVLLSDDLLQREAYLAGELREVDPSVLTVQQVRNEVPLPDSLVPAEDAEFAADRLEVDSLWETYYRHAMAVARELGSELLVHWVRFEVALRNALATARARRLGLEDRGYLVAADLADVDADFSQILSDWAAAATPLAGLRVVIRARWAWLEQHEAWFSFSPDELVVYTARLMLLEKWRRSSVEDEPAPSEVAAR